MHNIDSAKIKIIEDEYSIPSYAKLPVVLVRGRGVKVWDADGNEYLDLYGGHCVALIGHSHPHWVEAVSTQAARLGFYSNVVYSDVRSLFLEKLISFAPPMQKRAFLCNSGTEANETAIKLAIKATGRTSVIAMEGGFHGRTAGALSITHLGNYRRQFSAIIRETRAAPFGDIDALKKMLDDDVAAVILEPVQSMNGVKSADPSYYRELCNVCHSNGTIVIFDEIQTGLGRLGSSFAATRFDADVDMITLAKGIGGGFPLAAVLATEDISKTVALGEQGTTFGGGPVACAAGIAVLDVLKKEKLVEHAAKMESVARKMLIAGPVTGIRGYGLLLGLETKIPAKELCQYLFEKNILVGTSSDAFVARLMPPLIVAPEDLEQLADALKAYNG